MEEAYHELHQQFLRLRSLCLRQAALLHQLTSALQKQQGATVPNGELSDPMSIPIQCSREIPKHFNQRPLPTMAAAPNPFERNLGTLSDLLAEDLSKLYVDFHRRGNEDVKSGQKVAPLSTVDSSMWRGASSNECKKPGQAAHPARDRTWHAARMPSSDSPRLIDFLSQSDELLMSDVALQSHVCDFCQAVFPGDTTTKGEYIRHLNTHFT